MKNFISNVVLIVVGVVVGIIYWTKRIVCFPVDAILYVLSSLYMKIFMSTPAGYFSVIPNSIEELEEYYKRAETQVKKCGCEQCQTVLARAKMMKEALEEKIEPKVPEYEPKEAIDEIKCVVCGTVCKFNSDTRVYECPKCK
jgi:hypothetical protein